jgi:pSer/pThr/pTyr-binding forkhead associated (FHA) protein
MEAKPKAMPLALKLSEGPGAGTSEVSLPARSKVVIGRGPGCDLVVKDAKASRRHCQLTRKESDFVLEDLGSRNGTFVNGERIEAPVHLKPNQTFKVGDTVFYLA